MVWVVYYSIDLRIFPSNQLQIKLSYHSVENDTKTLTRLFREKLDFSVKLKQNCQKKFSYSYFLSKTTFQNGK